MHRRRHETVGEPESPFYRSLQEQTEAAIREYESTLVELRARLAGLRRGDA